VSTTGPTPGWREIADRVFVRRYAFFDQEIGVILGDGEVLVVDTRSTAAQARELLADLRRLTAAPWLVVNTHHHFDHAFGNAVFRPAEAWGLQRCAERLRAEGEAARADTARDMPELAAELAETVIDPPERTFTVRADLVVGGRAVELVHLGRGHTDNDVVVRVPDAGVLFAGDLVEQGAPPYFGDSYPLDWPATLGHLLDRSAGPIVPGHGDVVDRDFVAAQLAEIALVAERARREWPDLAATGHDPAGPPPRPLADDVARLLGWPRPVVVAALSRAFVQLAGRS
jgi:glyoxylase-like metal-dependent hydrolase (beta-lactamase superfamily II)